MDERKVVPPWGSPVRDVDVLYAYACLGAKCATFGLRLSASRSHIIIRDHRNQQVVSEVSIEAAEKALQYQIDNGYYEHSEM